MKNDHPSCTTVTTTNTLSERDNSPKKEKNEQALR